MVQQLGPKSGNQSGQRQFQAVDLLDRNKNFRRTVSAEYKEDIIGNTLGRFFMAGISFNLGKMNARNNSTAQSALLNMQY